MVAIPEVILAAVRADAQVRAPEEACGVVTFTQDSATLGWAWTVYPIDNAAPSDREHRFIFEPSQQLDVWERITTNREELFAIYHSHPHGKYYPSDLDREHGWHFKNVYCMIVDRLGKIGLWEWVERSGVFSFREVSCEQSPINDNDWFFEALSTPTKARLVGRGGSA